MYQWTITWWRATVDLDLNTMQTRLQKTTKKEKHCSLGCWCHWILKCFLSFKKRKTDTRNMLCCAILFCTFPEIQGVGYRKNPVREGRSAFSVRGLEKPLGRMEGKRQGLSYFLSLFFFFFSLHHFSKGLGWVGALSSLERPSSCCWEGSNDRRIQDTLVYCDRMG